MGKVIRAAALVLILSAGACMERRSVDVFCETHRVEDFTPSRATFEAMTSDERRSRLKILEEGRRRCGWVPLRKG